MANGHLYCIFWVLGWWLPCEGFHKGYEYFDIMRKSHALKKQAQKANLKCGELL
jgi:hypothetical protein